MKTLTLTTMLIITIMLLSCQKETETTPFHLALSLENLIEPQDFGYPCGSYNQRCESFPIEIWAAAYVGTQREKMDANHGLLRQGPEGTYQTPQVQYGEKIHFDETLDLEANAQIMFTISCWDKEVSFWINSGDQVLVEIRKDYLVQILVSGNTGENPFAEPSSLFGKWVKISSCTNLNGEKAYYEFDNNNKGVKYSPDCTNQCMQGQYLTFNYLDNYDSIDLNYENASNYCDDLQRLPDAETIQYERLTNSIIIGEEEWTKQ